MGLLSTLFSSSKNKLNFSAPEYSLYPDLKNITKSDKDLIDRLTDMLNVYNKALYKSLINFPSVNKFIQKYPLFIDEIVLENTLFIWSASTPFMKENNTPSIVGLSLYYSIKEGALKVLNEQIKDSYYKTFDDLIRERNRYFISLLEEERNTGKNSLLDYTPIVFAFPLQYVEITKLGEIPSTVKIMSAQERMVGFEILKSTLTTLPREVTRFIKG